MPTCKQCNNSFEIEEFDKNFLKKMTQKIGNQTFEIPYPTLCPDCRLQRRVAFRNESKFYKRRCDATGKEIISLFSPDKPYKVYENSEWWSDRWDGMDYGTEFDFNKSFFEQFYELNLKVPKASLTQLNNENCPYTTGTGYCKNCHLINSSENCENCYYGKLFQTCNDIMDCHYVYDSQLCYECFSIRNCYNCKYLYYSQNSFDCYFSENLQGCRNCFLCTNLQNKEYYFMNEKVTKEVFESRVKEIMGSHFMMNKVKETFDDLRKKRIFKYSNIVNTENSTGDFMMNCKNCINCYDINDSEDCKNVAVGIKVKDTMDCSNMYIKLELCYEVMGTIEDYNILFSTYIFHSNNVMYSDYCFYCKNIFGCSGLRNKEYCILNKQYTKEEYEDLVPQIIEHMKNPPSPLSDKGGIEWGEFFPIKFSPFAYNETVAQEYFPLDKSDANMQNFKWQEEDNKTLPIADGINILSANQIQDNIKDIDQNITEKILLCQSTGKPYKIIPQELKFYKDMNLPIPRLCPDERYKRRMLLRNPRKLWNRKCMKCNAEIKTTYPPDEIACQPELQRRRVYCEDCYLKEVY